MPTERVKFICRLGECAGVKASRKLTPVWCRMHANGTTRATYTVRPLDASTWHAFAELVERNGGIFGGCWCMSGHPRLRTSPEMEGARTLFPVHEVDRSEFWISNRCRSSKPPVERCTDLFNDRPA